MANLETILKRFGFVTVLNPKFYEVGDQNMVEPLFAVDSLRVANITQEGPTKEAKGGLYAKTLLRYGKTMRLEMEDVLGGIDALKYLMGAKFRDGQALTTAVEVEEVFYAHSGADKIFTLKRIAETAAGGYPKIFINDAATEATIAIAGKVATVTGTVAVGDKITIIYKTKDGGVEAVAITDAFPKALKIVGDTFIIDENGEKQWVTLTFPEFLPDGVFDTTMEAEGDFGVMNMAGELIPNKCGIFYYITAAGAAAPNCDEWKKD